MSCPPPLIAFDSLLRSSLQKGSFCTQDTLPPGRCRIKLFSPAFRQTSLTTCLSSMVEKRSVMVIGISPEEWGQWRIHGGEGGDSPDGLHNLLRDTILGLQTKPKSTAAGDSPRTSPIELTAPSIPFSWCGWGWLAPPQEPHTPATALRYSLSPSPLAKASESAPEWGTRPIEYLGIPMSKCPDI